MLPREKNKFHDAVKASGLEPGMFRFDNVSTDAFALKKGYQEQGLRVQLSGSDLWFVVFKVKHKPDDAKALFACKATHYHYVAETYVEEPWLFTDTYEFGPYDDKGGSVKTNSLAVSSGLLKKWIKRTIPKFIEEKSIPDLWQMASTGESITSLVGEEDTPFNDAERNQLGQAVATLQEFVLKTFEHNQQQEKIVNKRFNALTAALANQGRTTWFTFALGTLLSVGSTLYLTNEQGRVLLEFARQVLEGAVPYLK